MPISVSDEDEYGSIGDDEILLADNTNGKRSGSSQDSISGQPPSKKRMTELPSPTPPNVVISMAQAALKRVWGFPGFRLKQEAVIERLITGGSAVVVFPTGGGKSLTYQIPALVFDEYDEHCGRTAGGGVTLVVSPLIALMKDQVDALKKRGVAAAAMDSSQSRDMWLDTCDKLRRDQLKLLYVAPERLNNEGFIEMISKTKIRMVAIDEAHCISEWGHAFRPDYLKIARFVQEIQAERVLCLTATATPKVADDICAAFHIEHDGLFRTTTYRPNLRLLVQSFATVAEKVPALQTFLRKNKGPSIVYVQTHDQTETVCADLKRSGFNAYGYHAGMASDVRTLVQDKFMTSKNVVIVATIAFGMGIDKADIRNIVHYAVPKTLEGYSQEIGRAGRDGLESTCMIYLCGEDIGTMEEWSRADVPSLRSITGLVGGLLKSHITAEVGDIIERNLNDESREWDIRRNALDLLNAQLELRFGLIRAITPKYSEYKYAKAPDFDTRTSDTSNVTRAIKQCSKTAKKWTHVNVDAVITHNNNNNNNNSNNGVTRSEAVRKLQEWNDTGAIELQPSSVVHRFRVLKRFPQDGYTNGNESSPNPTTPNIDIDININSSSSSVSQLIYQRFEDKERDDIARIQAVVDLITTPACLNRSLARHFGDESSVSPHGCGHCQVCLLTTTDSSSGGGVIHFKRDGGTTRKGRIDSAKVAAILAATPARDDARFLARVGFGISSPRVTAQKLGRHAVFGSLADCDFEELVQTFNRVCE